MENSGEKLNNKYDILEKKGSGATSKVYLVKDPETEKIYAAKVMKQPTDYYDKEVEILKSLKSANNPFIVNLIENGTGNVVLKDKVLENKQYIVLENAPKGELFNYLYCYKQGLQEKYSKVIFVKILRGVLSCHKAGICHRDLKMQNILLDENYNPKICDFGFATFNTGKLNEFLGTINYAAPEILSGTPYDGLKADIFSLGVILINLVTCKIGFGKATRSDPYYRYIMGKHYGQYWKLVSGEIKGISDELKKLYNRMVSYRPNERPTIEEILNDDWIKEIRELNEKQLKDLEKEILEEFSKREPIVNEHLSMKAEGEESSSLDFNRGSGDDEKTYFDLSLKPSHARTGINMRNYIKINGNLNPAAFMNNLANKVNQKYKDNCNINESKDALKFNITFENELEDEVELPKELEEEFAKLGIEEEEDINENLLKKDCVIQCKLYESLNGGHILKFSKKGGELDDYYKNLETLTSLVKEVL